MQAPWDSMHCADSVKNPLPSIRCFTIVLFPGPLHKHIGISLVQFHFRQPRQPQIKPSSDPQMHAGEKNRTRAQWKVGDIAFNTYAVYKPGRFYGWVYLRSQLYW